MKQSPLFSLNWQDALKGLYTAIGGAIVSTLTTIVTAGDFDKITWATIWHGALVGGLAYLGKNFLTPADPIKEVTKTDDGTVTKTVIKTDSVDVNVK